MRHKVTKLTKKGRQTSYFEELLRARGVSSVAIREVGVSRQTLSRWRKSEGFKEREEEISDQLEHHYLKLLDTLIDCGNVTALIFALKALRPEKYDDNIRRQIFERRERGPSAAPVSIVLSAEEPPERIIRRWAEERGMTIVPKEVAQ